MFDIDVAAWRDLSFPLVLLVSTLVLGFLIVYGIGIGFNRQSAEPIFVDVSADSASVKRNKKKKKEKPAKPAGKPDVVNKERTEAVVSGHPKHTRPSAAAPAVVTSPSVPAPAVTTKPRVAETRRRDPEPWDQVVSRRQRRQQQHEQEERPDPARLEAAVLAQQERTAEDSTDSGIVNASPTKTKKKSKNKKKDDVRKVESIPPPLNLIPVSEPKTNAKPPSAAKVISDQFTTVTKKKKSQPKSTQNTESTVPVPPEPQLTRDDFYSSGNGSRVLSLEEAMAALKSQTAVALEQSAPHKTDKPAAKPATAAVKTSVPPAAVVKKAPAPPASKVPSAAETLPAVQLPGKPVPIEEMMARLRAGEDITQVSSACDQVQLKPAAAAVQLKPTAAVHSDGAATTNVAFDELGDAWTEQAPKPKKKKKTRKE